MWGNRTSWLACLALGVFAFVVLAVWTDAQCRTLLCNTLLLAAGAVAVALLFGTPLAVLLWRTDIPGRRLAVAVVVAMVFFPLYLQAAGWDAGFGRQGWMSRALGPIAPPVFSGWLAAVWIHGLAAVPWFVGIVGVGACSVEPELEESALLDGSAIQTVFRVTIPRSLPSMGTAAVWTAVTVATEMTVTDLYQIRTFAEETYTTMQFLGPLEGSGRAGIRLASGLALLALLVLASLVAVARLLPSESRVSERPRKLFSLGKYRFACTLLALAAAFCLVGVPLANLVGKAGFVVERTGGDWYRTWHWRKLFEVIAQTPVRFASDFAWTGLIGVVAATAALGTALPLAWFARRGTWRVFPALCLAAVCLALPGPVVALQVIWLLNRESCGLLTWLYDRTIAAPVLAQSVRAFPVAVLITSYSVRSVARELLDAAACEGAGSVVQFWRILLPLRWPVIVAAWLAAFAVCVGDLTASILVIPPGMTTIPVRVFGQIHSGVDDLAAGICLVMMLGFSILASLVLLFSTAQGVRGPGSFAFASIIKT